MPALRFRQPRAVNALVDRGIVDVPVNRILDTTRLKRIRSLLERAIDSGQQLTPEQPVPEHVRNQLVDAVIRAPDVRLSPKGVVFCLEVGFPQAFDALEGCQYVIPFEKEPPALPPLPFVPPLAELS